MSRAFVLDALALVLAWLVSSTAPSRDWIEHGYANGIFATMNRALVPLTDRVPFAVGDAEALVVFGALVVWWVRALRRAPRGRKRRTLAALLVHTAGFAALGFVLFELAWGLNYRRATVVTRIDYSDARVTDAAVAAFSERIVATLNADVAAAHAETLDRAKLRAAFEPIVQRLGDEWDVALTAPKTTLIDPYYEAAGIGGQYSPFAFETLLNASFLPVEVPRARARVGARRRLHRRRRRELHRDARVPALGRPADPLLRRVLDLRRPARGAAQTVAARPARRRRFPGQPRALHAALSTADLRPAVEVLRPLFAQQRRRRGRRVVRFLSEAARRDAAGRAGLAGGATRSHPVTYAKSGVRRRAFSVVIARSVASSRPSARRPRSSPS